MEVERPKDIIADRGVVEQERGDFFVLVFLAEWVELAKGKQKIKCVQINIFIAYFESDLTEVILEGHVDIRFTEKLVDESIEFELHDNFFIEDDSLEKTVP